MDWPIFLLGIVVGWVIEWLVDLLFWRKRQKKWIEEEASYQSQLSDMHTEVDSQKALVNEYSRLRTDLDAAQIEMDTLRRRLVEAETEHGRLVNEIEEMKAERLDLAEQFNRLSGLAATAPAAAGVGLLALSRGETVDLEELQQEAGEDLTMIEGIGPKIQELLYQNGIYTFSQLADSEVPHLQEILAAGGSSFRLADPTTWPKQARLAAAHDWVRLQALNEQLTGGIRVPKEPEPEDDLTMIEGIGPKISASLKEHGITTFARLAKTDVQRLQAILAEEGPAFKLAAKAIESWPEQASLAASGDWDGLHALKDTLKAGRVDAENSEPQTEA